MTAIYSKSHRIHFEVSPAAYGGTNLTWNHQHKATVDTAELLAALDAVPRADFRKAVALSEERQSALEEAGLGRNRIANDRDAWKARAEKAESRYQAERNSHEATRRALAEAEATIERVREVVGQALLVVPPGRSTIDELYAQLSAALNPPKPFKLPTKVGVRFEVKDYEGSLITFRTVSRDRLEFEYLYEGADMLWSGDSVMEEMTDHRLLDGDAA